jgi:23S rRNA (uracil1939-C5)-methyltransferase
MITSVTIEKLISDGKGLARPEGSKVVMVPSVLAGEVVTVTPVKEFRGYIAAELDTVISPSPFRVTPFCPWYAKCGGCDFQHAAYRHQLTIKEGIVQETMDRAGIDCSQAAIHSALASPQHTAYRHRIRLQLGTDGQIGFHQSKTHTLVPIDACAVAAPKINQAIAFLQQKRLLRKASNHCREIELLISPADESLTLLLHTRKKKEMDFTLLQTITALPLFQQAGYRYKNTILAKPPLRALCHDFPSPLKGDHIYSLSWAANCFSQVNAGQNAQLVKLICKLAGNVTHTSVLDLYCGSGNFSIPLALMGATVTGIELSRESITWAQQNAQQAGVKAQFLAADVTKALKQRLSSNKQADLLIIDPPRRGLGRDAYYAASLGAQRIIYISCDPATLARDLTVICQNDYNLTTLVPVDMFPQTRHIETVVVLHKTQ